MKKYIYLLLLLMCSGSFLRAQVMEEDSVMADPQGPSTGLWIKTVPVWPNLRPADAVNFFPNPTQGWLTINIQPWQLFSRAKLRIHNVTGFIVAEMMLAAPSTTINIAFLPRGTYFFVFEISDGRRFTKKVVRI